jgi:hypothetical protein
MESSVPTDEPQLTPSEPVPAPSTLSPMPVARERCAMCGATLAADQRYCVECGQRCGPSRLPFTDGIAPRTEPSPRAEPQRGRTRASVNATLIAGIGTLLLALGVGVLIGRLGTSSTKAPPVQVVTVAGTGTGSGSAGTTAGTASTEAQTSSTAAKTAKTAAAAAAAAKSAKAKAPAVPVTKVVKVGSKGSGPGYQHGHFTGNFFGG